ncbi:MAG: hypothetical protein QM802_16470 [Agriterribacter sp.]
MTIEWYEKFKVIPGLANVHGRFGFNAASFILSAPYGFSTLLPQTIYPVNGVLVVMFILWMFKLIVTTNNYTKKLCFLFILACALRLLFVNVSSPSSDALAVIIATYIVVYILDIYTDNSKVKCGPYLFFFILFSITVKITLLPLILFLPFLFKTHFFRRNKILIYSLAAIVIIVPWLFRNYLMSGYLIYPLTGSDVGFLNPDWKVPKGIIALDNLYIKYGPYMLEESIPDQLKLGFTHRLYKWIGMHFRNRMFIELFQLIFSLFSFVFWFIIYKLKKEFNRNIFYVWLILYASVLLWLTKSPDYRFGSMYLIMTIVIPGFCLLNDPAKNTIIRKGYLVTLLLTCIISVYYCKSALLAPTTYSFAYKDIWLFPLQDIRYKKPGNVKDGEKVLLNDGKTILYISDGSEDVCLHAPLPCMPWNYGVIELRGKSITDGFRFKKDDVKEHFPFLKY